ncbi:MAG: hypothetical protein EAZ92_13850 [Candidatus Kapaibacterium sp.]|nr:MAG: hypothetical protein EAZ92_13850 [Candidatus Kapabacteria bacterium]
MGGETKGKKKSGENGGIFGDGAFTLYRFDCKMNSFNSPKQGSMLPCSNQSIQNTVKTVLFRTYFARLRAVVAQGV